MYCRGLGGVARKRVVAVIVPREPSCLLLLTFAEQKTGWASLLPLLLSKQGNQQLLPARLPLSATALPCLPLPATACHCPLLPACLPLSATACLPVTIRYCLPACHYPLLPACLPLSATACLPVHYPRLPLSATTLPCLPLSATACMHATIRYCPPLPATICYCLPACHYPLLPSPARLLPPLPDTALGPPPLASPMCITPLASPMCITPLASPMCITPSRICVHARTGQETDRRPSLLPRGLASTAAGSRRCPTCHSRHSARSGPA